MSSLKKQSTPSLTLQLSTCFQHKGLSIMTVSGHYKLKRIWSMRFEQFSIKKRCKLFIYVGGIVVSPYFWNGKYVKNLLSCDGQVRQVRKKGPIFCWILGFIGIFGWFLMRNGLVFGGKPPLSQQGESVSTWQFR